jgi:Tol biopolymer transport system component
VQLAVSDTGTLVYVPGPTGTSSAAFDLALINRDGTVQPLKLPRGQYMTPRASPDGTRLAFGVDQGRDAFVAIYDLAGTTALRRLTLGANSRFPVWTSDGKRIAYQSDREGDLAIFWQPADGSGIAERLTRPGAGESHFPEVWSPTSNQLLFSVVKGTEHTLWTLSLPDKKMAPFAAIRSSAAINPVYSPDGRWLAYQSDHTRRTMLYVQPVPPNGAVYQLPWQQADQPHEAVWSPDGKELFYNPRAGGFEVVAVTTLPHFAFGPATALPRPFQLSPPQARRAYDVTPAGLFVGLVTPGVGSVSPQMEVVVNWHEELKQRIALDR